MEGAVSSAKDIQCMKIFQTRENYEHRLSQSTHKTA